ncbi:MAG TPA: gluconate 2-dehydrogenase subunit 3 family protein [Steroidobacteraceae bacterium]|nr:gluconate 2-dehydrogenase subunit 3 family protein [Steroidobacteraceae bacterium]
MEPENASRRQFLQASSGTLGFAWLAANWPQVAAAAAHAHTAAVEGDRSRLLFLNAAQARDVEAIAAQIVPSDDTPGAREAGVVWFVDHVHAGPWSRGGADFLAGLADFQARCARHHPGVAQFADLTSEDQLAYLQHVERTPFFEQMRFLTVLGLLASPAYGGNAGKVGWKLVGFVDQHAWQPPFGYYDAAYEGFRPYDEEAAEGRP